MAERDEQVLDAENWKHEASAVKKDVEKHVKHFEILESTNHHIYFNITTLEDQDYCIEMSAHGFRIVGECFNDKTGTSEEFFETPYSLIRSVSPKFFDSFLNELLTKLGSLV